MPRAKRTYTNQGSMLKKNESINSTVVNGTSKIIDGNHLKLKMWKAEVKDRIKNTLRNLTDIENEKLAMYEYEFKNFLMAIPNSILDTKIDINSQQVKAAFSNLNSITSDAEEEQISTPPVPRSTIRRRSRSASNSNRSTKVSSRFQKVRSSSVDMYKTPSGKLRLSSIMSNKKYTVTKPRKAENSGLHVKRLMKPDEEAISTCGSPLYVAASNLGAPHVNIPLPGGVVLNIEPKVPKGPVQVLELDEQTKSQIKILCEHLKKLV